ncbi:hypothetical protein N9L76_08075 [bacterium]|nr:hypothetical protein [bacterium]
MFAPKEGEYFNCGEPAAQILWRVPRVKVTSKESEINDEPTFTLSTTASVSLTVIVCVPI